MDLLWYLKLELIILIKNLIGYQEDVIKQDYIRHIAAKIELDQQNIDILVCDFNVTQIYKGLKTQRRKKYIKL